MIAIPAVWPIPRVGIIGVGNMGGAMAARLLTQGYLVAVNDIDAQREAQAVSLGATACTTATGLASSSDVVIAAVVDAAQTQSVLFGPHGAGCRGDAVPDDGPGRHRATGRGAGATRHRLDRRADVWRAGTRPRWQHEPDGLRQNIVLDRHRGLGAGRSIVCTGLRERAYDTRRR
jgi:hypothetical protein